jgi:NTP pyrophosphatase (non-canonical NTP hydrolase)
MNRPSADPLWRDSYAAMLAEVSRFHRKHKLRTRGGEELNHRIALMAEELGEISACVTKGRSKKELAEECADLLILLLGTAIAARFDLREAFWHKLQQLNARRSRMVNGRVRVSDFRISSPR